MRAHRVLGYALFTVGLGVFGCGSPGDTSGGDAGLPGSPNAAADAASPDGSSTTISRGIGGPGPSTAGTGGAPAVAGTGGTTATGGAPAPTSTGGTTTATGGSAGAPVATGTGGAPVVSTTPPPATTMPTTGGSQVKYVFVITMENEAESAVYGSSSAPYLNTLRSKYASTMQFSDPLPDAMPSEPHYIWMEAGTNAFSDATFTTDSDPSASNSTASTEHLVTQMQSASPAVAWTSYQEGLGSSTGACPVRSSGFYAAKHDPFVFFKDTAGSPPSATNAACAAHHQAYTTAGFATALANKTVARYNFITPNLCNDMHGATGCPNSDLIASGDSWLAANLPAMIDFVNANSGVIFIVWDEPEGGSTLIPFLAIGPHVKPGYAGSQSYNHGSLTKTVEEIFGLPILPSVVSNLDFGDLFEPGFFP
jgi:hypothetical protein